MINVLINAYAVSPTWGSEPGMGWNWIVNIANYCNVFVITEGQWEKDILDALEKLPNKDNIHFYFNPVPDKIRKMCWNQGDWRFYWHYAKWQKKTLKIAKDIMSHHHIDVIHQLNMIGFREPGYLWKIKNIPFVWGPIGGIANVPISYLKDSGWKIKLFFRLKNLINNLQFRYHRRVRTAAKKALMIAAIKEMQEAAQKVYNKDIPIINETGTNATIINNSTTKEFNNDTLHVLWVGKFDYRKRLDIALKALALTNNKKINLSICGTGTPEQIRFYKSLSDSLNINHQVTWMGNVNHDNMISIMQSSDILLFTSISDATSTVVLEAVTACLPIISFNLCGFGPIVKEFAGKVVELTNIETSIQEFADNLNYFYNNRCELEKIALLERKNAYFFSWEYKSKKMVHIYERLLSSKK